MNNECNTVFLRLLLVQVYIRDNVLFLEKFTKGIGCGPHEAAILQDARVELKINNVDLCVLI